MASAGPRGRGRTPGMARICTPAAGDPSKRLHRPLQPHSFGREMEQMAVGTVGLNELTAIKCLLRGRP